MGSLMFLALANSIELAMSAFAGHRPFFLQFTGGERLDAKASGSLVLRRPASDSEGRALSR